MTSESMCAYLDKIATSGTYYPSFDEITLAKNSRYNHIQNVDAYI